MPRAKVGPRNPQALAKAARDRASGEQPPPYRHLTWIRAATPGHPAYTIAEYVDGEPLPPTNTDAGAVVLTIDVDTKQIVRVHAMNPTAQARTVETYQVHTDAQEDAIRAALSAGDVDAAIQAAAQDERAPSA